MSDGATWQRETMQRKDARSPKGYVRLLCFSLLLLTGCSSQPRVVSGIQCVTPAQNASSPLVTPTYDASGTTVEPTVLDFPNSWHGFRYWMVASPFPNGDANFENPSIFVSQDGTQWSVPHGLTNPVVLPTQGILADGTVAYDATDDELWLYYLNDINDASGTTHEHLLRTESKNGVNWTKPRDLLQGLYNPLTSPSVVNVGGIYFLWNVVVGASGCGSSSTTVVYRTSTDGLHWSAPQPTNLSVPNYIVWHLNVTRIPGTNQLLIANTAYPAASKSCGDTILFFGTSFDGITWSNPQIMLNLGPKGQWDERTIYRSSFLYDDTQSLLRIWYSADGPLGWHVGYSQTSCTTANQSLTP
jgi:hypothetical protein